MPTLSASSLNSRKVKGDWSIVDVGDGKPDLGYTLVDVNYVRVYQSAN